LGNGLIALTGSNDHARVTDGRYDIGADPAGLELVDVRDWTTRTVDPDASDVVVGAGLLFAVNGSAPVRAYDYAGHLRFDLDGIRGIAVLVVLLYHTPTPVRLLPADSRLLPGGWLGVDVFFVLSGYLITRLLLAEQSETGRIDRRAFYGRRVRRLLPAVVVF